jgi:hypothetical protein
MKESTGRLRKLLNLQKNGQFPDDLVKIDDVQIHCVNSQTYYQYQS